jgi:galactitol-specific phosphotransferase system IIC component
MSNMQPRRKIGFFTLLIIGLAIGMFLKSVKIGLVIGLLLGVMAGNVIVGGGKRK